MTVVVIEAGAVVLTLRDVADVDAAYEKYPTLSNAVIVLGDHPYGTLFANGKFTAPPRPPSIPVPDNDIILSIRDLAEALGPAMVLKIEARFGGRRP